MDDHVTRRTDIERVLADPDYGVPGAPTGAAGLAWLRSSVSRFVNGPDHIHRRALVETEIDRLDPDTLRREARERTVAALPASGGRVELMSVLARPAPLGALARGLGVEDAKLEAAVAAAAIVGPAYLSGAGGEEVDAAVEELRRLVARDGDEETAAAIAVLAQACEATAGLIANALLLARVEPALLADVDGLVATTLRRASPLLAMRRVGPRGETVTLDLDAAGRHLGPADPPLAFGSGIRPCPGAQQAVALAAGVLEALLPRCALEPDTVAWFEDGPLRLPRHAELVVR